MQDSYFVLSIFNNQTLRSREFVRIIIYRADPSVRAVCAKALTALVLRSWVPTPLRHGYLSSYFCVVLSSVGRGFGAELITRPKKSYRVSNYIKKPFMREVAKVF
jgi:hypothetical protein